MSNCRNIAELVSAYVLLLSKLLPSPVILSSLLFKNSPAKHPCMSPTPPAETTTSSQRHNSKLGLQLFAVYFLFYFGFVAINAFSPSTMEWQPWGGMNLALLYGFSLIIAALLLAFVYGLLATTGSPAPSDKEAAS
jgi:uncharacterized membrane protein (DUF485 family)